MSRLVVPSVLLLAVGPAFAQPPALPPDLALVPTDGTGFVHVRAAELWADASLKDVRDVVKKAGDRAVAALDERFAGLPSNVDRLTMWVGPTRSKYRLDGDQLFVVRTTRPTDPAALRKLLLPDAAERKGKRFPWYADAIGAGLLIADDRTFVLGPRAVVARVADGTPPDGPLADGLAVAAGRPITVGVHLPALPADWRTDLADETPDGLRPVLAGRSATASLDLAGEGRLHVRLGYPSAAAAAEVSRLLTAPGGPARQLIAAVRIELEAMIFDNKEVGLTPIPKAAAAALGLGVLRQAEDALASDKVRRDGSAVEAVIDLPARSRTVLVPAAMAAGAGIAATATEWREEVRRQHTRPLRHLLLGWHGYNDTNFQVDAAILDPDGKPLLSWRVALLPYIEQDNLFKQFRLNEPWDSEHNKQFIGRMPKIFEIDGVPAKAGHTHYRTFVGPKALWDFDRPTTVATIADGSSNTVVFVQAAEPTIWTKPDELPADGKLAIKPRLLFRDGRTVVGLGDGSARFVLDTVGEDVWKLLIDPGDGQILPDGVLKK